MNLQIFHQLHEPKTTFGYGDEQLYVVVEVKSLLNNRIGEYKVFLEADFISENTFIVHIPIFKGTYEECTEELKKYEHQRQSAATSFEQLGS